MANRTCSEEGCAKAALAKTLCVTHYHRQNAATKASRPTPGICRGCGERVPRNKSGPPKHYCSVDCRPRCNVDGCEKPQASKSMCSAHATRATRYGDPLAPKVRASNRAPADPRRPRAPRPVKPCSVEGCDLPSRKRGWCTGHWGRWRKNGDLGVTPIKARMPRGTKTTPKDPRGPRVVVDNCEVCGQPNRVGEYRSGRFCSAACMVFIRRHGGVVPPNPQCARCSVEIDITALRTKAGHRKRADTKLCAKCKTMHSRHWASPGELALRDGPYCQLCGCDVDLLAMFPDVMRPSVDHIIPRAWGGTDDPENLQLTHLRCNHIKSDRYIGVSSRSTKRSA